MASAPRDEEVVPPLAVQGGTEALRRHLGEWVALTETGEIVGHGKSTREASYAAKKAGAADFALQFVPKHRFIG